MRSARLDVCACPAAAMELRECSPRRSSKPRSLSSPLTALAWHQEIIASLDVPVEIDPGLASEMERRAREVEAGTVKAIPWFEVRARIASRRRAG
jgi:hypothetical protein